MGGTTLLSSAAMLFYIARGGTWRSVMSGVGDEPTTDRRGVLIGRLVEHYQAIPDPEKWLQAMTLQALRVLDRADLSPADKSPARREIHAIHREVASRARAARLSGRTTERVAGGPPGGAGGKS
jgi:hypothetical protein